MNEQLKSWGDAPTVFDDLIALLNEWDVLTHAYWDYEVDYGATEEEVVVHIFQWNNHRQASSFIRG